MHDQRSAALAVAAGLSIHLLALAVLIENRGYWIDEYFTLWATDPALPFGRLVAERILPDSNLPTYFTAVAALRRLGIPAAIIGALITEIALAATAVFLWRRGGRIGARLPAAVTIGLLYAAGPLVANAIDLRVYPLALCLVTLAAWLACEAVFDGDPASTDGTAAGGRLPAVSPWLAVLVGAGAGVLHLFAALAAAALALGVIVAAPTRLRSLVPGLALGAGAGLVAVVWVALARSSAVSVSWIPFDARSTVEFYGRAALIVFGGGVAILPVRLAFGRFFADQRLRPVGVVAGVALVAFAVLPVAASFVQPVVYHRYLVLCAPIVFTAVAWGTVAAAPESVRRSAAIAAAALLLTAPIAGLFEFLARPVITGGVLVGEAGRGCPAGSIKIDGSFIRAHDAVHRATRALASGLPPETFAPIDDGVATGWVGPRCPVLAWVEPLTGDSLDAPEEAVFHALAIEPAPGRKPILVRLRNGFVVLAGAPTGG